MPRTLCLLAIALTGLPGVLAARPPTLVDGRYGSLVRETDHTVHAEVDGFAAQTVVTVSLQSTSGGDEEGILRLSLPPQSAVLGLELLVGNRWMKGHLLDALAVRKAIADVRGLPRSFDPAWIEQVGPDEYRLRVYPVPSRGDTKVRLTYIHPLMLRWGKRVFVYPRRGSGKNLAAARVELVDRGFGRGAPGRYRIRVPATLTLERALPDPAIQGALRASFFVSPPREPAGTGHELVVVQGNPDAARRHWNTDVVFLVDRSRSMWRGAEQTVDALVSGVMSAVGAQARFGLVILHRVGIAVTRTLQVASADRIKGALAELRKHPLENGTQIAAGLKLAYGMVSSSSAARRRLIVLITDGLLPERAQELMRWPQAPKGVEVLAFVGRPYYGVTRQETEGPIALLTRGQGGLTYTFDPEALHDGSAAGEKASLAAVQQLAAALARPGRVTELQLKVDGKERDLLQGEMALLGGFQIYRRWKGAAPRQAVLSFGYWGKRESLAAAAQAMPKLSADWLELRAGGSRDRAVGPRRSLIVIHPADAFGRDRLAFALRWGGRFFQRMSPPGALDLPVGAMQSDRPQEPSSLPPLGPRVKGRLTRGLVATLLADHYVKTATRCYQATGPRFKPGQMVLYLDLTRGEVADAWIDHRTLQDASLEQCLIKAANDLTVAHSYGDETLYRVTYPMRFAPEDRSVSEVRGWRPPPRPADPNPLRGLNEN